MNGDKDKVIIQKKRKIREREGERERESNVKNN